MVVDARHPVPAAGLARVGALFTLQAEHTPFRQGIDRFADIVEPQAGARIVQLVRRNHARQRETLAAYGVGPDLFAASALDRAGEIHRELGAWFLENARAEGVTHISEWQSLEDWAIKTAR